MYNDPSSGLKCLTGGGVNVFNNSNPKCQGWANADVHVYPEFNPNNPEDSNTDFAVITSSSSFVDVFSDDYASLDIDTLGSVERLEVYGYGFNAYAGTGSGILRRGSGELDSYERHHFNVIGSGARVCKGDSGGPATIYFDQTSPHLVAVGVLSESDVNSNPTCAEDGSDQRYSRISPKMTWVEQQIGATCRETRVAGRRVKQCF